MLAVKILSLALFGLFVQDTLCHKDVQVKYLEDTGDYKYDNRKLEYLKELAYKLDKHSDKQSSGSYYTGSSGLTSSSSSSSSSDTKSESIKSESTSSTSSKDSSTSSGKDESSSSSSLSSTSSDGSSSVSQKVSSDDLNESNAEIIKQYNGKPLILYAKNNNKCHHDNYDGKDHEHDCNVKVEYGKQSIEGKSETIIHRPAPIVVRRPPTKVLIKHAPLIVKQAPVVYHTPGKIVEHKVVHKHLPRPVHVRPVTVKVIKPIEKKIIIDRPVKPKVLVEKQPERKYYLPAKGCDKHHENGDKYSENGNGEYNEHSEYNGNYENYENYNGDYQNNENYGNSENYQTHSGTEYENGNDYNTKGNNNGNGESKGYEYEGGYGTEYGNGEDYNTDYYNGGYEGYGNYGDYSSSSGGAGDEHHTGSNSYGELSENEKQYIVKSDTYNYNAAKRIVLDHERESYSHDSEKNNENSH